jgi:hypothetical protein
VSEGGGTPVAWLLIEPGWEVVDAEGSSVGQVEEVVGDQDIFSGVAVSSGLLGKPRWVPAELVAEIIEGRLRLAVSGDAVEQLDEHEPGAPPETSP